MPELLAPAGSFEALIAAISNGADAIYLGLNKFGARAYANNFSMDELEKAIKYAHLRNVKLYVTMNTIVYDDELEEAYKNIAILYQLGVDGIIIQDLAIFSHVVENYPQMEAHCSTQMGIDDLDAALFFKNLGAKRLVLAREIPIEKIKEIKKKTNLPIEVFIHGALCVSYSGNCLMSGLIGYRSGNRGRCVGSCRKLYTLQNETTKEILSKSYLLSMKDLNTIERISELNFIDSLKIEGRMKEPIYVANVVSLYRKALDSSLSKDESLNLKKTFNRTFTKGYIFHEDKKNITNIERPNNYGYPIGKITKITKQGYEITLSDVLNQQDTIRINHNQQDINLSIMKLYDDKNHYIASANRTCYLKIKERLSIGDIVYKTKDYKYTLQLEQSYPKDYERIPISLKINGKIGFPIQIDLSCEDIHLSIQSDFLITEALNAPTTREIFLKQFNRLKDTVYEINTLDYFIENGFIPLNKINDLRRICIDLLNQKRTSYRPQIPLKEKKYSPIPFQPHFPKLAVYCSTKEQYEAARQLGVEILYTGETTIRRNEQNYPDTSNELLIGGYGGIHHYQKTNSFVTDYSLNVVNSEAVYLLCSLGAKRVTLSYEINQKQIQNLIEQYFKKTNTYPNLEMIVYGRAPMMFTHYCPLKPFNQCGKCKENTYILKDEFGFFPIVSHKDCTTTILNGKILNLIDDLQSIENISVFRIQLTLETYEESISIIKMFQEKLKNKNSTSLFNKETDTRGHFNKEIL